MVTRGLNDWQARTPVQAPELEMEAGCWPSPWADGSTAVGSLGQAVIQSVLSLSTHRDPLRLLVHGFRLFFNHLLLSARDLGYAEDCLGSQGPQVTAVLLMPRLQDGQCWPTTLMCGGAGEAWDQE